MGSHSVACSTPFVFQGVERPPHPPNDKPPASPKKWGAPSKLVACVALSVLPKAHPFSALSHIRSPTLSMFTKVEACGSGLPQRRGSGRPWGVGRWRRFGSPNPPQSSSRRQAGISCNCTEPCGHVGAGCRRSPGHSPSGHGQGGGSTQCRAAVRGLPGASRVGRGILRTPRSWDTRPGHYASQPRGRCCRRLPASVPRISM